MLDLEPSSFLQGEDWVTVPMLYFRVPTGTGKPGKHGKWLKNMPFMENSWNLKNDEISRKKSWNFVMTCQFVYLWDSFFSSLASLAR